jgi:prepilin-type N-terminal cleavage/methylation domain-containing protein
MRDRATNKTNGQRGFTLVEMLIATIIVIVGLVAVAQLVPTSVMMNSTNRNDGAAVVFAQQQMEALRAQPFSSNSFTDATGTTCYPANSTCYLGDPAQPNQCIGNCPLMTNGSGVPIIDFSATPASGYSFTYIDLNDPYSAPYDVRWAVITSVNSQHATTCRRIIVGVFRRGMKDLSLPVTLDSMIER